MARQWNPAGRNRVDALAAARRRAKDPFNRAALGTRVHVERVPCPNGACEHAAMLHDEVADDQPVAGPRAVSVRCTMCDCREIRWPDEEPNA